MSFKTKFMAMQYAAFQRKNPPPCRISYAEEEDYVVGCQAHKLSCDLKVKELWRIEVEDARAKAYLKAIQEAEAALIRQRVQKGDFEGMPELQEIMLKLNNKRGNGGNLQLHYFVTVNVKPGVSTDELAKKVEKYVRRSMVRSAEYVYEQRGAHEGEMGKGLHCHLLVTQRGDVFDGKFKENTRNTFKSLVGSPQHHVDIRAVKPDWVDDKREYMKGAKTQEGKAEKVAMDRVWRVQNNLRQYYNHANSDVQAQARDPPHRQSQEAEDDAVSTSSAESCGLQEVSESDGEA